MLGCNKYHVKRLDTSLRCQTRVSQRRLGCLSAGPSEVHSARLFAAPDTAVVDVGFKFLSPKTKLLNHTSKQANDPSTICVSDFAQNACFDLRERDLFCDLIKI